MVSSPALRRTVRRCTAVLVLAVGVAAGSVVTSSYLAPSLLAAGALLFLLGSVVYTPEWAVEDE
ncbi:hypothetical protein [Halobellus sp. EA9]|uniref:hypothetical protein n=1 Tax=Halobellus sp. EA9 TaxID=3421647 RepID=UPI003EBA5034